MFLFCVLVAFRFKFQVHLEKKKNFSYRLNYFGAKKVSHKCSIYAWTFWLLRTEMNQRGSVERIFDFTFPSSLRVQNKQLQSHSPTLAPFRRRTSLSPFPMPPAAPVTTALLPVRAISSTTAPVRGCRKWHSHGGTLVTARSHPAMRVHACRIWMSQKLKANSCFCLCSGAKRGKVYVSQTLYCLSGSTD